MSVQVIAPTTEIATGEIDLSRAAGPTTFRIDGVMGVGEEIIIKTINSDDSSIAVVENTVPKVLKLDNTTVITWSQAHFKFEKTATANAVGLLMDKFGK